MRLLATALTATGACLAGLMLAAPAAGAETGTRPPGRVVAAPSETEAPSPRPAPEDRPSRPRPPGIEVGPETPDGGSPVPRPSPAPEPSPPSGQEGSGSQNGGDPAWWDLGGRIRAAINDWFRSLVKSALNPIFGLIGRTLLATPDTAAMDRVRELWRSNLWVANTVYVLLVLAGGVIVMSHETLQTRYTLKQIAPRVVVGFVAANASLSICSQAIRLANALSAALMGAGVRPGRAADTLTNMILSGMGHGGIFLVLIALVAAALGLVLIVTYIARVALTVLVTAAGPLALACHALPQTEPIARLWWRALTGCLAVQLGQSLTLIAALRVFFSSGWPTSVLNLPTSSGLVSLLVVITLLYILVRIPAWVAQRVFTSGAPGSSVTRIVRHQLIYQGIRAVKGGK